MRRFFGALVLAGVLLAPGAAFSAERHRYYDRTRHDWHEWNENEGRAYRHWLMEEQRERQYREYARLRAARQREYWRWRHSILIGGEPRPAGGTDHRTSWPVTSR